MKTKTALQYKPDRTSRILGCVFLLMTVLLTIFIFANSGKDASSSAEDSERVTRVVEKVVKATGAEITPQKHEDISYLVRKCAHFTEFAALGILAYITVILFCGGIKKSLAASLYPLAAAITDELTQLGSTGRSAQATDVAIDFFGAATGIALLFAILFLFGGNRTKLRTEINI